MTSKIIAFAAIILSLLSIIFFFKGSQQNTHTLSPNDNRLFFWNIYSTLIVDSDGYTFDLDQKLTDIQQDTILLKEIFKQKNTLIFRFSKFDCNLCIDQVLDFLVEELKFNKNLILIVDGFEQREFKLKYKDKIIPFETYFLLYPGSLGLKIEGKNLPFLFISKGGVSSKIFMPFKEFPNDTKKYIESVSTLINYPSE